jgi:hypothetical protein
VSDHFLSCRHSGRVARSVDDDAQLLVWTRIELFLPEGLLLRV